MVRVKSVHAATAVPFKDTTNVQNRRKRNDNHKRTPQGHRVKMSQAEGEFIEKN